MDKSDAEYSSMWSLRRGGQEMFSVPRVAAFRSFVLHHIIHHRGQLSVYLRLNDVRGAGDLRPVGGRGLLTRAASPCAVAPRRRCSPAYLPCGAAVLAARGVSTCRASVTDSTFGRL